MNKILVILQISFIILLFGVGSSKGGFSIKSNSMQAKSETIIENTSLVTDSIKLDLVNCALPKLDSTHSLSIIMAKKNKNSKNRKGKQIKKENSFESTSMWLPRNPIENYTLWLLIFSAVLALISIVQIVLFIKSNNEAVKAANAAMESNAISRQVLIAEQRPWIKLEIEIGGSLRYDDKGWDAGTRWHFPLKYRISNIGKSPGTNVSLFAEIIPLIIPHWSKDSIVNGKPKGMPLKGTDIPAELERICGFPENMTSSNLGFGQTLFPNEHMNGIFGLNGSPNRFEEAKSSEGYTGQFLIVICVSYGSTFDKEMYRTAKAFHLFKNTENKSINLNGVTIPVEELEIAPHPNQIGNIVK